MVLYGGAWYKDSNVNDDGVVYETASKRETLMGAGQEAGGGVDICARNKLCAGLRAKLSPVDLHHRPVTRGVLRASLCYVMAYHQTVFCIEALLQGHNIPYKRFDHKPVRTSEEAAAVRPEYSISQGAKALIVRIKRNGEKTYAMIVVPGDKRFDSAKARTALGVTDIRFATEDEVRDITDGVEPGGVPPFGTLWNLPVYCDRFLFNNDEIIFNAGDRAVSIALSAEDWKRVVHPIVAELC